MKNQVIALVVVEDKGHRTHIHGKLGFIASAGLSSLLLF